MTRVRKRCALRAASGAVLVGLVLPSIATASTTVTVTGTGDSTSGTCTTMMSTTACTTLRAAVLDVTGTSGGGTVDLDSDQTYTISQGQIDGGDNPVTVNGIGSTIDLAANGDKGFFAADASAEFENLTLEKAAAPDADLLRGAGGTLTLNGVAFSHNSAAAEVSTSSGLALTGVSFSDDTDASAITLSGGTNTFGDVTFSDQTGNAFTSYDGGSSTIDSMSVEGGTPAGGGAIVAETPLTIDGLSISGLTGSADPALALDAASTVTDLSVTGNQLASDPVQLDAATVTGRNWTVADNTSSGSGTSAGGGIEASGASTLDLTFATLDANSDSGDADELYATGDSTIDIGDSIVTGSTAGGALQCVAGQGSAIDSTGYNLDQAGGCGFSAIGDQNGVNPRLGPLANAAVSGLTDPVSLSYAPLEYASPAVGVIPAARCSAMTDELGDPRPQGPSGCDIGAYESPTTAFSLSESGAPATASTGTAVTYTLSASNASSTTPQHAVIADTLPAGASVSSASVSVAGAAPVACSGTTTVSCPVGALPRGKTAVATIVATLNTPGANVDTANVSSEYPDVDDAAGTASATTQVSAPATPMTTPVSSATPTTLVVSGVTLTPARFAARGKATLRFTASAAGSLTATVTRSEPGVKSGKSCVAPPKHAKAKSRKCTRAVRVTQFTVAVKAGANTLALPAKVRDLAPGKYHLRIATTTLAFTVIKSKRVRKPRGSRP